MIITLNQSEIESALTAHINNLMNLKDGIAVKYEFKATRGDEGFTAVLDITDGNQSAAHAQPVQRSTLTPAQQHKPKATPVAEVKEEAAPFDVATQKEESPAASTEAAENGTAQAATAEEANQAAPAKPSLFANLKQPK